ncbi:MAG: hypothetical protein SGJ24_03525 [Chloroflexota bacterium]|nr:hypothetical protein [Chloroflexota bacterium]
MSSEYPLFIFVGSEPRRAALESAATTREWSLCAAPADALYGTLAQVVAFFPDAVVIEDSGDPMPHEIVMHLNSIHFEPLIVISDSPETWDSDMGTRMVVLASDTSAYDVLDAVLAQMNDAEPMWA